MKKFWNDEKIIKFMERKTGILNGIVARDDDGYPICYMDKKDNGKVYGFDFTENSNEMEWYEL